MLIKKVMKIIYKKIFQRITKEEYKLLEKYKKEFPKVLSTTETLQLIINNKISLCRYGDGEFDICNHENINDKYQKPSEKLTKRLTSILLEDTPKNLLICIPPYNYEFNNIRNYYGNISFWEWYWLKRFDKIKKYFNKNMYGNSFVSRDAVFYENDLTDIKKVWENRKVTFVIGKNSRFNVKNEIFNNIKSYNIIYVQPVNAFEEYDSTLLNCLEEDKNTLFLLAAGPTATVLAYDLTLNGYQALDIGHLPNCYDQFLGKILSPESLPLVKIEENKDED